MPYEIETKDGIVLRNIPDNIAPDSDILKNRVQLIRQSAEFKQLQAQPAEALPTEQPVAPPPGLQEVLPVPPSAAPSVAPGSLPPPPLDMAMGQQQPVQQPAQQTPAQPAPAPTAPPPGEDIGFWGGLRESITGARRQTPETQTLPEWTRMPELNRFSAPSLKAALGTLVSSPQETVQVLQSNFPEMGVRQDAKGNFILRSTIDGQEYIIPPGVTVGDIPRIAGGLAIASGGGAGGIGGATLSGAARGIGKAALTAAGGQAAIEASQAATGGEFNTADVGLAGAFGGAGRAVGQAVGAAAPRVTQGVRNLLGRGEAAATQAAPEAAQAGMQAAAQAVPETIQPSELGSLVRQASGGNKAAADKLVELSSVNPEALKAAENLGFDLPVDVFSDNPQFQQGVGLIRSKVATEASAAWEKSLQDATQQADKVMNDFDAVFIGGTPATGAVSQSIRDNLISQRTQLADQAKQLYESVDAVMPKTTKVQMPNLQATLGKIESEVGANGLSSQEKSLMKLLDGDITYGRIQREKNLIGQALQRKESPYGNMEAGALKRLYAAISQDQLDQVGAVAGENARQTLRAANFLTAKDKALGKRIVTYFGSEQDGSIAQALDNALRESSRGGSKQFNQLLKIIPDEYKKEAVATSLSNLTRAKSGVAKGQFGFSEFSDLYPKLRANPEIYSQIVKTLGEGSNNTLQSLYIVSKRITDARAKVLATGKANQEILNSFSGASSLLGKVLQAPSGKKATRFITTVAGAKVGGVPGAGAGMQFGDWLTRSKNQTKAVNDFLQDVQFQNLLKEAATNPNVNSKTVKRVAASKSFRNYAKNFIMDGNRPSDLERWIMTGLQYGRQQGQPEQAREAVSGITVTPGWQSEQQQGGQQ